MTDPTSVPQSTSAGEFRLDLELADEAVRQLEVVKNSLLTIRQDAHEVSREAREDRTTQDLISREAFALLADKADGAPGSLGLALDGAVEHVQVLIERMRLDIDQQRQNDEVSAANIRAT